MAANSSGFFVQGRFGTKGNFEVVVPRFQGHLLHMARDNDSPNLTWSQQATFGSGDFDGSALIQSNFSEGGPGNFEVVTIQTGQLLHFWRTDVAPFTWYGPQVIANGVSGNPALIQGTFGVTGNFELVAPLAAGGVGHWWRDNDDPALAWHGPTVFGAGEVGAVSLIQSSFGSPGNLEAVAIVGPANATAVAHFWRDGSGWHGPIDVPVSGAGPALEPRGEPGFVQTADGDFEVVVSRGHVLTLITRDNSDPALPWRNAVDLPTVIVPDVYTQASLIQGNYGPPGAGNLELVARSYGVGPGVMQAFHFWREAGPGAAWQGPTRLPAFMP
jgi:hypothetical protein